MKRIIHLSDPHFGAADEKVARAFLQQIHSSPPDLTILSGDMTMRASHTELAAAGDFIEQLPHPRILIPGNHDMPGAKHLLERLADPFRRYRNGIQQDLEPEVYQDGIHTVCLNSSRPWGFYADWSEGRLSSSQLARAEEQFMAIQDAEYRVLVLHHPLVELALKGRAVVKPLIPLLECMARSKVDFVLCGHFHRSIIMPVGLNGSWQSIVSQAPTVCSTRLQGEPQGYHEISFDFDHAEIVHHVYNGSDFSASTATAFERKASGWWQSRLLL